MPTTVSEQPEVEEEETPGPPPEPDEPDETEQEGEQTGDQPEQTEPPSAQGPSEKDLEELFKKLGRATETYTRKITDLFGDDALYLARCPLCPAEHMGFVNTQSAGNVPDDVVRETLRYMGHAVSVEYRQDVQHDACAQCDGLGKVRTGSRVPQWETIVCSRCNGSGFYPPPGSVGNGQAAAVTPAGPGITEDLAAQFEDRDPTGEPRLLPDGRDNPNFMKWPQGKVLVEPWGVTANLTAAGEAPAPVGQPSVAP